MKFYIKMAKNPLTIISLFTILYYDNRKTI